MAEVDHRFETVLTRCSRQVDGPIVDSLVRARSQFGFFAVMMVAQLLFVRTWMPETRGRTLEDLSAELTAQR